MIFLARMTYTVCYHPITSLKMLPPLKHLRKCYQINISAIFSEIWGLQIKTRATFWVRSPLSHRKRGTWIFTGGPRCRQLNGDPRKYTCDIKQSSWKHIWINCECNAALIQEMLCSRLFNVGSLIDQIKSGCMPTVIVLFIVSKFRNHLKIIQFKYLLRRSLR